MATYYNSNGGGGRNNDWGSWIPIIILFCIPSPFTWIIAFIWLVSKLRGASFQKKGNVKRHPYDIQQDAQNWEQVSWEDGAQKERTASQSQSQPQGQRQAGPGPGKRTDARVVDNGRAYSAKGPSSKVVDSGRKQTGKQTKASAGKAARNAVGNGLIISGAIVTGIFSLGTVGVFTEMLRSIMYGNFFPDDLVGLLACLMFLAGGVAMLASGIGGKRRAERYANYLAYIGANREVSLAHMAATFGVSVKQLCKDLRRMLSKGVLPTGYLDLAEGKLFLTEMGYRPPEPKQEKEPAQEPSRQAEESEDAILREIRQVNDEIPDVVMSAKIDRIEEITGKILVYQKKHPNREGQLRSFLNYYLPTTLKILRAYAQLDAQGIEGENISAAKARIEGMMDQVVAGFEKQLDKLFQDDALDITADVEVLENMLKKDGLSDGQGMTLGM